MLIYIYLRCLMPSSSSTSSFSFLGCLSLRPSSLATFLLPSLILSSYSSFFSLPLVFYASPLYFRLLNLRCNISHHKSTPVQSSFKGLPFPSLSFPLLLLLLRPLLLLFMWNFLDSDLGFLRLAPHTVYNYLPLILF